MKMLNLILTVPRLLRRLVYFFFGTIGFLTWVLNICSLHLLSIPNNPRLHLLPQELYSLSRKLFHPLISDLAKMHLEITIIHQRKNALTPSSRKYSRLQVNLYHLLLFEMFLRTIMGNLHRESSLLKHMNALNLIMMFCLLDRTRVLG